jgi:aspartate/methionine/tyrosine aminotransferase
MRIPPFKLERFFAEYEFNVEHLLCGSDCESMSIAEVLALEPGAGERFEGHRLSYTEAQGSPTLRAEIAGIYESIESRDVLVLAGAEEGIFLFMHAVLDRSDHLIVHWPCYQSLFQVAASAGCEVSRWEARESEGWALDIGELRSLLRPNTKAIVLNVPHNPTGYLMRAEAFRAVSDLAEERGILLFSDEVYRESEYDPVDRLPAACDLGTHGVSLGVMSKTYGLAGLRLGWIATTNDAVRTRIAELKDYTTICTSAPSEFLAEVALRHRSDIVERNLGIIRRNLPVLDRFFETHAETFSWVRPSAGSIAFPRLLRGDIEHFWAAAVKEAGVLLLPRTVFSDEGNHFRIGFGRAALPNAVDALDAFVRNRSP